MNHHLKRDTKTNAIINSDKTSYEQYLISKQNAMNNLELNQKIDSLEKNLDDIKTLLLNLLNK